MAETGEEAVGEKWTKEVCTKYQTCKDADSCKHYSPVPELSRPCKMSFVPEFSSRLVWKVSRLS